MKRTPEAQTLQGGMPKGKPKTPAKQINHLAGLVLLLLLCEGSLYD